MRMQLEYGRNATLAVDIAPGCLVAKPAMAPIVIKSVDSAAAAALAAPLGYPPFSQVVMPGDRVVLAVDRAVPQVSRIVRAILDVILESKVRASDVVVLLAAQVAAEAHDGRLEQIRGDVDSDVRWIVHDPAETAQLAYLAATGDAHPVYVNRLLCDADVVVPISSNRVAGAPGYFGVYGSLYPTFSDVSTIGRFHAPGSAVHVPQYRRRCAEAKEVAWLLGVQFAVQAIPGPGDSVLGIVAGQADEVAEQSGRMCSEAWAYSVPHPADLVLAMVNGDQEQQNWHAVGHAVYAASRVCRDAGVILVCSELGHGPGRALAHLASPESDELVHRRVLRERSPDAQAAALLLDIRGRQHVFLLSRLTRDVVEGLGVGYVADAHQVQQLVHRSKSCIVVPDAQNALPILGQASVTPARG